MNKFHPIFFFLLIAATLFGGCSNTSVYETPVAKGISLSHSGLYPSRDGESYGVWFEVPVDAAGSKQNKVQHSNTKQKFVASFRVAPNGSITDLDTANLLQRLGTPLALAIHAIISVEKTGAIDSVPYAGLLAADVTGNVTTGTATLTTDDGDGLNYTFSDMTGALTLANAAGKPAGDLELYLMRAASSSGTAASIDNLPVLPSPWHYALWAIDSATKSNPPFNIFYGTFTDPVALGSAQPDSQPGDNHFPFPGGRYPADQTQPVYRLNSGRVAVMVTAEPMTERAAPSVPFGAILLKKTIPAATQGFSPIEMTNETALFPTVTITIHR